MTNATGSVYVIGTSMGKTNIIYQTVSGTPIDPHAILHFA
jgi:hypothetical protein